MLWIETNRRVLRLTLLALLFVALLGPWAFDAIYLPPEYTCSGSSVRLNEHLCGKPLSGMRILVWAAVGFVSITEGVLRGTADGIEWVRELLFCLLLFMPTAPFLTALLLAPGRHSRRRQLLNLCAWTLTGASGLVIALSYLPGLPPPRSQWGVWLAILLAGAAVFVEGLLLAAKEWPGFERLPAS